MLPTAPSENSGQNSASLKNSDLLRLDLNHPPGVDRLHDHHHVQPPIWRCPYCRKIFPSAQSLGGHHNAHRKERFEAKRLLLKLSQASQDEIIRFAKTRSIISSTSSSSSSLSLSSSSSNPSASGLNPFNYSQPPPLLATPDPPRLGRYKPPPHLKFKLAHWPFNRSGSSPRPVERLPKFRRKSKKPTAEKSPCPPSDDHHHPPSHKQQLTFALHLTLALNPPPAGELGSSDVSATRKGKAPRDLDLSLKL